jgi:hypothetical protein
MNTTLQRLLAATTLAWGMLAQAALPEPPDPREVAQLTTEQRIEQARALNQALSQASPQEREAFRAKAMQKMRALSPEERQQVHQRMRADWAAMTDAQRNELRELRKARVAQMTPEERAQMREQRRRMFERMSPEEQKKWRDEMRRQRLDHKADPALRDMPGSPSASVNPAAPVAPHAVTQPDGSR